MDTAKRHPFIRVPVGRRWEGKDEGDVVEGQEMVRRTGKIFAVEVYIEKMGGAGTGPGEERGSWKQ